MGGPYRAILENGEIKVQNLMRIDGREVSIQWNNAVANKAALNKIIKTEKKVHRDRGGNYKVDTGAKTGDVDNISRSDNYVPEYYTDQRYDVKKGKYVDDEFGFGKDTVTEIREKYNVKGLRFKNKAQQFAYKHQRFSLSGEGPDTKVNKTGFAMHPDVMKEGLKKENIKKQIGLDEINEDPQFEMEYENASEAEQERMEAFASRGDFSKKGSVSAMVAYDIDHGFISEADRKAVHDVFKELLAQRNENQIIADNVTDNSKVNLYSVYKKATDPVFRKQYAASKKLAAQHDGLLKTSKNYDITGADKFSRAIPSYLKDINEKGLSKDELKSRQAYNKNVMEMSASPEGRAILGLQSSKKLLNMDMSAFFAKDFNDAIEKYEQLGQDSELPFVVQSGVFIPDIEYNPIIAEEIKYNYSAYENGQYNTACARYLADGGVALFNDATYNDLDINALANAHITNQNTKNYGIVSNATIFLDRQNNPGIGETIAELEAKGIIGPNSKYFNAMKEYTNEQGETVKERILFSKGIEELNKIRQAAKNPDGPQPDFKITFEEKTPEQKKALDEALKTIGKPKPVPNPGPLYGDGLTKQLQELMDNLSVIDNNVIEGSRFLTQIKERISDAILDGIDTPEEGLHLLNDIRNDAQNAMRQSEPIAADTTTKRAVQSFYIVVKNFAQSKITSVAIKNYAKANNLEIKDLYTDAQVPTSRKGLETKRLDNFSKEYGKDLAKDIKSYSKGKLKAGKLIDRMADLLTLSELKNKVMDCDTAEELNAFKKACSNEGLAQEREKRLAGLGRQAFANAIESLSPNEVEAFLKGEADPDAYKEFALDVEYNKERLDPQRQSAEKDAEAIEEENAWLKYDLDQAIEASCKAIADAREAQDGPALMQGVSELIAYSSVKSKIRENPGTIKKLPTMEKIKESAKDIEKELPGFLKSNTDVAKTINEMKLDDKAINVVDEFGNRFKLYAVGKSSGEAHKDISKNIEENIAVNNKNSINDSEIGGPGIG